MVCGCSSPVARAGLSLNWVFSKFLHKEMEIFVNYRPDIVPGEVKCPYLELKIV